MSPRGLFITIEGGEGVGKSTNIAFLEQTLIKRGIDVVVTREPGGTQLGEEIRSLLLKIRQDEISPMAELLMIFAARAQHILQIIEPALSQGRWVLCDRFTDATYAYQCGGRGIDVDSVGRLENLVQNALRPDSTILLDAPVTVGMSRAIDRGALDRIELETTEFFQRVREAYLQRAAVSDGRMYILDVARPLEDVQRELIEFASELLSRWDTRKHRP
jgi:dTMP kinase